MPASGPPLAAIGCEEAMLVWHGSGTKGWDVNRQTHGGMRRPCALLAPPTTASHAQENQKKCNKSSVGHPDIPETPRDTTHRFQGPSLWQAGVVHPRGPSGTATKIHRKQAARTPPLSTNNSLGVGTPPAPSSLP